MSEGFRHIGSFLNRDIQQMTNQAIAKREARKQERIIEYGWHYDCQCDECGDTGFHPVTHNTCYCDAGRKTENQRRIETEWKHMVPPLFVAARIETHPNKDAAGKVKFWVKEGYPNGQSLILTGSVGTGKTGLAIGAMREVFATGAHVTFDKMPNYLRRLRPGTTGQPDIDIDEMCFTDLLVVDDIGTEKITEWAAEQMMTIIDTRNDYLKPTIVTTNLTLAGTNGVRSLESVLGERMFSRLIRNVQVTPVAGTDLRKARA